MSDKHAKAGKLTDVMHAAESPEQRLARKRREYDEEDDVYAPKKKKPAESSLLSRLGRAMTATASKPWARLSGEDDE